MTKAIKTNFGVVRKNLKGELKGYVNFGKKYFHKSEEDIMMDYVDHGYVVESNEYVLQGGSRTVYLYKYKDEFGMVHEDELPQIEHPTMVMVTKLKQICT
tara:strand:- start:482 stop:781 length:300 start_codon:yes stop_codon:yes gene_type:complete